MSTQKLKLAVVTFVLLGIAQILFAQNQSPVAAATPSGASTTAPEPEFLKNIPIPRLHDFHPEQPKRIELKNGMVIFLEEDHELPLISGSIIIRGGSRDEPANKVGLVDLYGDVWRTGGTTSKTGDQLDDLLEAHAAKVETNGGEESTGLSFSCLKGDLDLVFDQAMDVLRHPSFRADKLDLAKQELYTGISRRNDESSEIAGREAQKLVYGPDNPYAREPEYATADAVTREDLVNWHKAHLLPNYMIVGIAGDFDSVKMEARLRQAFESWPAGPKYRQPEIAFHDPKPGMYFVEKSDVNQSQIQMVALGTRRDNPDFYALQVMNQIFSGGFGSRLFNNIRTKLGLAYAVGGAFGASYDHPGVFHIAMSTKSGTTAAAIDALYKEVDNLRKDPPSPEELKNAKDKVLNSFIFNYDSKDKILSERMRLEFYGYPADFLERYRTAVEKVTIADVSRVASKYVDKSKLAVLVVGNSADFDRPLASFGTVAKNDISIPGTPPGQ